MEAAEAAELPTAHISHLHRARWFHTGGPWTVFRKRQMWTSILLQDLSMHAHLRSGGPRPLGSVLKLSLYGRTERL